MIDLGQRAENYVLGDAAVARHSVVTIADVLRIATVIVRNEGTALVATRVFLRADLHGARLQLHISVRIVLKADRFLLPVGTEELPME